MIQLEQGHVIIMAVLLVIRVEEEMDDLEGHLCMASGILQVLAQVNGPDGGGGQAVGCSRGAWHTKGTLQVVLSPS